MYNNFVIAGLGGSGTMFLANMMDKSPTWRVKHEDTRTGNNGWSIDKVNEEFEKQRNKQNYGDVNGFLRDDLFYLNVDKTALILRDPNKILLSWFDHWQGWIDNPEISQETDRRKINKTRQYFKYRMFKMFNNTFNSYLIFEQYIKQGIKVIQFDKMVSDADYLNEIIQWAGIDDLTLSKKDMVKINPHYKKRCTYDDIPDSYKRTWNRLTKWFAIRYIND